MKPTMKTGSARVLTSIENMRAVDEKKKKADELAEKEKRKKEREERKAMKCGMSVLSLPGRSYIH